MTKTASWNLPLNLKNNEQFGTETGYYPNGKVKYVLNMNENGKIDGKLIQYYENGQMSSETPYTNGIVEGVEQVYYENGKLKELNNFVNNAYEGIQKTYYDDGALYAETNYAAGQLQGVTKTYYKTSSRKKYSILPTIRKTALIKNILKTASWL